MPWRATDVETERLKFIAAFEKRDFPFASLCDAAGISRKTGYKLVERYRHCGVDGLKDRSHARHEQSHRTSEQLAKRIVTLRRKYPHWGSRKLIALLEREAPDTIWPAASTVTDILKRHGLVNGRRRRFRKDVRTVPFGAVLRPNDTWCIDFKGWFRTGDGMRCDPLTLIDAKSRYTLACRIVEKTNFEHTWPELKRAFREYGLPVALRSDNGPPFGSGGIGGLSRLGVQLVKLGIRIEHIEPGKPQQNGRQERFHLTLKNETTRPPRGTARDQQRSLDRFREQYNHVRPHEALDYASPAEIYEPSPRPFPRTIPEIVYSGHVEVRSVRDDGFINWRGRHVFVSETLAGEQIGLEPMSDRLFEIRLGPVMLGILNDERRRVLPYRRLTYLSARETHVSSETLA